MNLQFLKNPEPRYLPSLTDVEGKIKDLRWLDVPDREKILEQLKTAFLNSADHSEVLQWRAFWMIFTDFSWLFLNRHEKDFFEQIIIGRQLPMAALLGYDLLDEILHYLNVRCLDSEDMASLYGNARRAFFNSPAIIGKIEGRDFLVRDLVKKEKYLNSVTDNTLEEAAFRDDLQRAMFPKEDNFLSKYFIYDDKDLAITGLLNLTDMFLSVEPDRIWYIVDAYVNPEKYEAMADAEVKEGENISNGNSLLNKTNLELPENLFQKNTQPVESASPAPSYKEIASKIENEQARDTEGNFVDLDSVFSELDRLAEKYNDPKINELYYFDEGSGTFKWNF